jgi:hypothetical protein
MKLGSGPFVKKRKAHKGQMTGQTPEASKKRIANTGRQVDKSARTIKPFARQFGKDREA